MPRRSRWLAALLAVSILINLIPVSVFAQATLEDPILLNDGQGDSLTEPASEPTETEESSTEATQPEEPSTEATQPEEPSTESTQPEEPSTEATEPEEPSTEATEPEEPATEAIQPEEPSTEATTDPADVELMALGDMFSEYNDAFAELFAEDLYNNGNGFTETEIKNEILKRDGDTFELTIKDGQTKILNLLTQKNDAQTDESNYAKWNIILTSTGVSDPLKDDFMGLGTNDYPYEGQFKGNAITIKTEKTLFNALSARADLNGNAIQWLVDEKAQTPPQIPILTKKLVADNTDEASLNFSLLSVDGINPLIGQLTGTGSVTLPDLKFTNSSGKTPKSGDYGKNLGLICCEMGEGSKLTVQSVELPDPLSLSAGSGSSGILVGTMETGAVLTISKELTLKAVPKDSVAGGVSGANVGGLVGKITDGQICLNASVSINANLDATQSAGGIAGVVTSAQNPIQAAEGKTITLNGMDVKATQNAGVLFGSGTVSGSFDPLVGLPVQEGKTQISGIVRGNGNCGGIFGSLTLTGEGKCTMEDAQVSVSLKDASNSTFFGGVVGKLDNNPVNRKNVLILNKCTISPKVDVGQETGKYPKYVAGVAAQQGATVDAKNCTIIMDSPRTGSASNRGVAGISSNVLAGKLLRAEGITVETQNDSDFRDYGGGGIAGTTGKGSIVYLAGEINLSKCKLTSNDHTGHVVGYQDCSLIYAPGAQIQRYDVEVDDIGRYGEVYRIPGFLTIGEDYSHSFPHTLSMTSNACTLIDALDYACFALAWQSQGNFSTVEGINTWQDLKTCTINLGADISLKGYGIGGLTRDILGTGDENTFSGKLIGNGKSITLDIGAKIPDSTSNNGDGRIFRHNAPGLFATLSNAAQVEDLTLKGSIRLANTKYNNATSMHCGALASRLYCAADKANSSPLKNVSLQMEANAGIDVQALSSSPLYVGGLFGYVDGNKVTKLELDARLTPRITVTNAVGNYNHIGGVIGFIAKDANIELVCKDTAVLSGAISSATSSTNAYVGGLVATVVPEGRGKKAFDLSGLTVEGFSLTANAKERMGGILGGIWSDTDVTMDGLQVTDATLTANGTCALGGLVYRASGKWTVGTVNLGGLKIVASSAKALGLLVCQGGPYKEAINYASSNYPVGGLYLEMTKHWAAYTFPTSIAFSASNVFDEFVAYTAYAEFTKDQHPCNASYDITANGSGIISLKTKSGTVNMEAGENNTYENRTSLKQVNRNSRYYYNLPTKAQIDKLPAPIDTPEELLVWSVYHYAASNLQTYFTFPGVEKNVIDGPTNANQPRFDMKGLSYYPINLRNTGATVQNAEFVFYNQIIEDKETGNKSTRGTAAAHSQHYTMHCGLFLNFYAQNSSTTTEHNLKVNNVSFSGTVGVVNGSSGALICGRVEGENNQNNIADCTVILAQSDNVGQAVRIENLQVVGDGDYKPVLIGSMVTYCGLKANYVTTTQTTVAGSSLVGTVGGENANNVKVAFAGTIDLPGENNNVFTRATLLDSLRYQSGSATYRFKKGDTFFTYGKEIAQYEDGTPVSVEYAGEQGRYDDEEEGQFTIANTSPTHLPYVYKSPATNANFSEEILTKDKWHEIAVNVRSTNLLKGCGTYGHPYQVDGNLLKAVMKYVNNNDVSSGWQVCVPVADVGYHTRGTVGADTVLIYDNGWKILNPDNTPGATSSFDVRKHLTSAYYELMGDVDQEPVAQKQVVTLKDFAGLGTREHPFTGVIKGKTNDTAVIMTGGSNALIQYSYGSVVRDLKLELKQPVSLTWQAAENASTTNAEKFAQIAPKSFFGGVIGCVLGGDNVLTNVSVSVSTKDGYNLTLGSTKAHLIPVGGLVGVIAGGGVIFRGSISSSGFDANSNELYHNPIIGRVLGGYAFYEGAGNAPNNTDKNYTINKLNKSDGTRNSDLSWVGSTLTVQNGQGLLILSGIISSGAGSTRSLAYVNGTARSAAYDQIGKSEGDAQKDYALACATQVPYLLYQYAGCNTTVDLCRDTSKTIDGIQVELASGGSFDMAGYGSGYRGLSARYVSNAAYSASGVTPDTVVMRVKQFNGNGRTVQNINMDVKEYADDDFHAASLGGIFNLVWTQKHSGGTKDSTFAQNLTLSSCNVQLTYVDASGTEKPQADVKTIRDQDGLSCVAVGGFIGNVADIGATSDSRKQKVHNYLLEELHISGGTIKGPNSTGGLIGAAAMTYSSVTGSPGVLVSKGTVAHFAPSFRNCSFSGITVDSKIAAGGLAGCVYASTNSTVQFSTFGIPYNYNDSIINCYPSCTVTKDNFKVGENSHIYAKAKRSMCGGLFGVVGFRLGVNDPAVNTKTGLNIASASDMKKVVLDNVDLQTSWETDKITLGDGSTINGPEGGNERTMAGGLVGRIGNVNPVCFYDVEVTNSKVIAGKMPSVNNWDDYVDAKATEAYVGGIVGSGYTNTENIMIRCHIRSSVIRGGWSGGFLGHGYAATGFNLNMVDCSIQESRVHGSSYSGGLVGYAQSKYYFSNVLIKNTSVTGSTTGRMFGYMNINNANNNCTLYATGISIYADPDYRLEDGSEVVVPDVDGTKGANREYIGYVAYADYLGTDTEPEAPISGKAPYVKVTPNYTLKGVNKQLYGDAVGQLASDLSREDKAAKRDNLMSIGARIWEDNQNNPDDRKNKVTYPNAVGKTKPEVLTFAAVQGIPAADPHYDYLNQLPVLTLRGGTISQVENYLDILTNGGYSKAGANVTLSASAYYWDTANGKFVEITASDGEHQPSIYETSPGVLRVDGQRYDNEKMQFSLVEAKFTNPDKKDADYSYTVSVPVVVIRELQYVYSATFAQGKQFLPSTYDDPELSHLLGSVGEPFTAYLTFRYNEEYVPPENRGQNGKKTQYVPYDWQGLLDTGGNLLRGIDREILFDGPSGSLPDGTQLTLLDCQNGNRAYTFTTKGITESVRFSQFTSVDGRNESPLISMADTLRIKAETAANNQGSYHEVTTPEAIANATVRIKDENGVDHYYCYTSEGNGQYHLKYPTDLTNYEAVENFFLVITVPKPEQEDPNFKIQGSLKMSLNWSMPSTGTILHRSDLEPDPQNNTESTYEVSYGYQQKVTSIVEYDNVPVDLGNSENKMWIKVKDEISFSLQQSFADNDALYVKFTVGLRETLNQDSENNKPTDCSFPVGVQGKVQFYIQDKAGNYYTYHPEEEVKWRIAPAGTAVGSYEYPVPNQSWSGKLNLVLSEDGTNPLDLALLRQKLKSVGKSDIIVTAVSQVKFGEEGHDANLINQTVPGSDKSGSDKFAQLNYMAQISVTKDTLDNSTARESAVDPVRYYHSVEYKAVLSMDADIISQLGVNPLSPVPEYLTADGKSHIELTAALDLSGLENPEQFLANTDAITFSLSLTPRNGSDYYSDDTIPEVTRAKYLSFRWPDDSTKWSWTIQKGENGYEQNAYFDGTRFIFPLDAYVSMTPRQYANYRISLKVAFDSTQSQSIKVDETDAYVVYTYACIHPTFYGK